MKGEGHPAVHSALHLTQVAWDTGGQLDWADVPWASPFYSGMCSHRNILFRLLSSPDQPAEILSSYVQQSTAGRDLLTHIVTYQCDDQVPPVSA